MPLSGSHGHVTSPGVCCLQFIKYSDAAGFSVVGKMFAHSNACLALATSPDAK
jgi:hypothetical protein